MYSRRHDSENALNVRGGFGLIGVVNDFQGEGYHEAARDGRNESGATVAGGIYVYRMTAGRFVETKELILMK